MHVDPYSSDDLLHRRAPAPANLSTGAYYYLYNIHKYYLLDILLTLNVLMAITAVL